MILSDKNFSAIYLDVDRSKCSHGPFKMIPTQITYLKYSICNKSTLYIMQQIVMNIAQLKSSKEIK